MKQDVERETTEEQIAENEGHEQFKESQRIEPAAKVQGGKGAAKNAYFEKLNEYNVVVTTLITTVTFAAALHVPGGYDNKGKAILVKSRDFRYFLISDSLAFATSASSLLIHFCMPALTIPKMTSVRYIVQPVALFLSMISLSLMLFAFMGGVAAILDEESKLYYIASSTVKLGWVVPVYVLGIIFYIFIIRLTYLRIKIRPFIS